MRRRNVAVMADDPDAGTNGEVRYSLAAESGGSDALFAVDPYSGWVSVLAPLDREARAEHHVALLAADGGATRRVARGSLVIRLVDYNDCPPEFRQDLYDAEVSPPATLRRGTEQERRDANIPYLFNVQISLKKSPMRSY